MFKTYAREKHIALCAEFLKSRANNLRELAECLDEQADELETGEIGSLNDSTTQALDLLQEVEGIYIDHHKTQILKPAPVARPERPAPAILSKLDEPHTPSAATMRKLQIKRRDAKINRKWARQAAREQRK